jgi:predicted LPLAT superfamily acyltransferase
VAALQVDRTLGQGRVLQHQLFGSPQAVPEGPFRLAGLAQVPIVSVFASRRGFFDYELSVGELLHVERRPNEAQLMRVSRRVIDDMELAISSDPTQWFHFEPSHAPRSA